MGLDLSCISPHEERARCETGNESNSQPAATSSLRDRGRWMPAHPPGRHQTGRTPLHGVEVDVRDAVLRLPGQAGDVVVLDVVVLAVEQVEHLELEAQA